MSAVTTATARIFLFAAGLTIVGAASAEALPRRGAMVVVPPVAVNRPAFYDPFWGPWYPYGYVDPYSGAPQASVKTDVTPKDAQIYTRSRFISMGFAPRRRTSM